MVSEVRRVVVLCWGGEGASWHRLNRYIHFRRFIELYTRTTVQASECALYPNECFPEKPFVE